MKLKSELILFALAQWMLLCQVGHAQSNYTFDFNTPGQLAAQFTGTGQTGNVSQSTNTGMNGTGAITVVQETNAVYVTKQGYTIGGAGSVYEFTTYMKSVWNSGYGGVGFTTDYNATFAADAYPTNSIGISVHGGGYIFNSGSTTSSGSWSVSGGAPSDLLNSGSSDQWYKIVYTITQKANSVFDVTVKVYSVYNNYSLVRPGPDATQTTSFTNISMAGSNIIYAYFCFGGSRISNFDDYTIRLTNSSVIQSGCPIVTGTATQSGGNIALSGNVTSENGATVTEKGFVWSTSVEEPTVTNDTKIANGTGGTGTYTSQITAPASGTYYIRAYAANSNGTSYGAVATITIDNPVPSAPTGISATYNILCNGASTQLTASGAVGTVYWYTGSCGGTQETTGNPATVTPASSTTYYARNYNNSQFSVGCASISIVVNLRPTVADLQATGTGIKWYLAQSGGTALATDTQLINGQHYWASQTANGSESAARFEVVVTMTNP